jgi:hypothetical protein
VRGLIWVGAARAPCEKPDVAALQRELDVRRIIPWPQTGFETAKLLGQPQEVRLDDFAGWRYAFSAFQENGVNSHDVVVVSANDGCGAISLRIETSPSQNPQMMDAINDLLSALMISKSNLSDEPALRGSLADD